MVTEFIAQHRRKHPQDQWIGFGFASSLHLAILFIGGIVFIKPAQFGVDRGPSSIEVQLVDAPVEPVVSTPEPIALPVENTDAVQTPVEQKIKQPVTTPVVSSQGAVTEAKPDYLKNPAPKYPLEARRNRWEGVVELRVSVDKDGHAADIKVLRSSGHTVLDEAALKTVKTWQFRPARLGTMNVESSVVVPVRFDLKKQ